MSDPRDVDDATVIRACEKFFEGADVGEVMDFVNAEEKPRGIAINRNQVYQLIKIAKRRKFFVVVPPLERVLEDRLVHRYRLSAGTVHVANSDALTHVASTAADTVLELIDQIHNEKEQKRKEEPKKKREERKDLRIGLGGGWTTMLVAKELATRMRGLSNLPSMALHALSSGFDPRRPQTAPVSFFGLFEHLNLAIEYVGLFAAPVADANDYARIVKDQGVSESFVYKNDLDLVITSLGSASHSQGDFSRFMTRATKGEFAALRREKWVGDVQYRPYSATGPILSDKGIRAVTLLELSDLHRMASNTEPGKHVVVVAGPCSICGHSRSDAVLPLLEAPDLKIWTHLVMDRRTASQLLPTDGSNSVAPPLPPVGSPCT